VLVLYRYVSAAAAAAAAAAVAAANDDALHCIALHCEKAPTGWKQDASGGTWPLATFCSIVAEPC